MIFERTIKRVIISWVYRQRAPRISISDREILDRLENIVVNRKLFLKPEITQTYVAKEIAVNRTYLTRALKSIDTTYKEYINAFRVQYAMKMMIDKPNYSSYEIAELSGFGTLKTMDLCLKRKIGVTSSKIRKRNQSMK